MALQSSTLLSTEEEKINAIMTLSYMSSEEPHSLIINGQLVWYQ